MDAEIAVHGTDDTHGELAALLDWLDHEDEFRGRVRFAPAEIKPGELGGLETLLLAAIAAGGLDVLGRTIVGWLQTRRSSIEVTVTAPDGSGLQISAQGAVAKTVAQKLDSGE
ncbi:hypothetical protein [Glycomyces sp. NRRL B-16210]|uniref:effector-associated constant component EACC1 n=1 Tax=Glycomyces sp. NRRL B-16210 TaxID=1463821 RepID=UPI0004C22DCD|nr:hypothetical protein [Glycomyces sp. NRRL B-16210]